MMKIVDRSTCYVGIWLGTSRSSVRSIWVLLDELLSCDMCICDDSVGVVLHVLAIILLATGEVSTCACFWLHFHLR